MKTMNEYLKETPPSISDYGYIGDCHSSALISKYGSIDWCCMPRIDAPSCFGRLIGWETAGYCQIAPIDAFDVSRSYHANTMVLKTHFQTVSGEAHLYDFFAMRKGGAYRPYQQILRIIEGIKGHITFQVDVVPRFDYGSIKPWILPYKKSAFAALGGSSGLLVSGSMSLRMHGPHHIVASVTSSPDQRQYLSLLYQQPDDLDGCFIEVPSIDELDFRLTETIAWWEHWAAQGTYQGHHANLLQRSALVLKCLSNAPTGAIAAAATTSLPETLGGVRNWDYRYSWIRDSYFAVRSLIQLGFVNEAEGFRRFIERNSHNSPDGLQTLFGVYGERRLHEYTLDKLAGYRGSKPIRIGNAASKQLQLDMYGELLDLAWDSHNATALPEENNWAFIESLANTVCLKWSLPDFGIWEMRVKPRHFTHSKVMCWVALDRGIRLAEKLGHDISAHNWHETRDRIRTYITDHCYDKHRGVFIQAPGFPQMDAALLLLPIFGFIQANEDAMIKTIQTIQQELEINGLLRRYPVNTDGLKGEEGAFIACSFWLVICLAQQGDVTNARRVFHRAASVRNDLDLFSEQYDIINKEMLGNFPQALTHLSLIMAALALDQAETS